MGYEHLKLFTVHSARCAAFRSHLQVAHLHFVRLDGEHALLVEVELIRRDREVCSVFSVQCSLDLLLVFRIGNIDWVSESADVHDSRTCDLRGRLLRAPAVGHLVHDALLAVPHREIVLQRSTESRTEKFE